MSSRYDEYEKACVRIREDNEHLLSDFSDWLEQKGLSESTIRGHVDNMDFNLDHYLLYEDAIDAAQGVSHASMFLGYWFIRKAAYASVGSIRRNAASLKKFYVFLLEKGLVDGDAVKQLHEIIKEQMPDWLATMRRYDDPSITDAAGIWGR